MKSSSVMKKTMMMIKEQKTNEMAPELFPPVLSAKLIL